MQVDLQVPWQRLQYIVVDVEGNGQQPPEMVEIAATPIDDGNIGTSFTSLIRPERPITRWATSLHGITNADVRKAPSFTELNSVIERLIHGKCFVAHNLATELSVLKPRLKQWSVTAELDTLWGARRAFPGLPSYSLEALAESLRLESFYGSHRASLDSRLTSELLLKIACRLDPCTARQLVTMCTKQNREQQGLPY